MSEYAKTYPSYVKQIFNKQRQGRKLTDKENRVYKSFFKNFWLKHPEFKQAYANARKNK